jgi:hypothetical protein
VSEITDHLTDPGTDPGTDPLTGSAADLPTAFAVEPDFLDDDVEIVDALPVVVEAREVVTGRWSPSPTVQAAAAAATGFVAGAATLALMRRYGLRRVARDLNGLRNPLDAVDRWPASGGFGQAHTYIVQIRSVAPRPRPPE